MKIAGWICLIMGLLSFIGAASKGHSVFGPCFFIALGAFFLYRVNNKDFKEKEISSKNHNTDNKSTTTPKYHYVVCGEESDQETTKERLEEIQSQLTINQKESALCLIAFFGGFNNNIEDQAPLRIFRQAAQFFGLSTSPMEISQIMAKHSNADEMIETVISIKSKRAKDVIILSCYEMIKSSSNSSGTIETFEILGNIADNMGYTSEDINQLLDQYQKESFLGRWSPEIV